MTIADKYSLSQLNSMSDRGLVAILTELFGSPQLADYVASTRPYSSLEALLETADEGLAALPDSVFLSAVNAHPPIGGRVAAGSLSEAEQSASAGGTEEGSIRALNPEYHRRFGHVFLIKAAGLSSAEILAAMKQRLEHSAEEEKQITRGELAKINRLRLTQLYLEEETK